MRQKPGSAQRGVQVFSVSEFLWALGSLCVLHQRNFSAEMLAHEFPPEPSESGHCYTEATLLHAAKRLGFKAKRIRLQAKDCASLPLPLLIQVPATSAVEQTADPFEAASADTLPPGTSLALITAANAQAVVLFQPGSDEPQTLTHSALDAHFAQLNPTGENQSAHAWLFAPEPQAVRDDSCAASSGDFQSTDGAYSAAGTTGAMGSTGAAGTTGVSQAFSFRWFVPELLRHKTVWRDVLLASLALQLVTLATPLFTQAIIDKVVVHRTQSTLITIGIAMGLLTVFSALLSWGRQYLVLHTGNRVDAVLGAAVWSHLLKLPPRYFERRPTGVVAARLHAVETIREFVSGAAVSLVLDLPFLLICLGVMLWYSIVLSSIAVGILSIIAVASLIMAPVFQRQLNEQFLLGARNQAFVTEHIAGFETVKTLQMEPQLRQRYSGYLASLLASALQTKQVANTYNTVANGLQQLMTLAILITGAWMVMNPKPDDVFTVGMLVAFQMFSGKLSEPVLRIVGLWTQFQQASLAVERLGDVMNSPTEPYSLTPQRRNDGQGLISVQGLGFRYGPDRPYLYENLSLTLRPGQAIAIMGPSGSGKSTLAKLMLGFYTPSSGSIQIDGIDVRNLSANELRAYFGVVPQETILFSGTILENLRMGCPAASFEQVTQAAKLAGIHTTIEQLPQGYESEIGERGSGLSGGQKQRIAIARALLKRPKILIFDEATSALDAQTAEGFAQTINQLKGRVSMLFITHALPKSLLVDGVWRIGAQARQ